MTGKKSGRKSEEPLEARAGENGTFPTEQKKGGLTKKEGNTIPRDRHKKGKLSESVRGNWPHLLSHVIYTTSQRNKNCLNRRMCSRGNELQPKAQPKGNDRHALSATLAPV